MLPVPQGVHVWLAPGHTDMRKGFPGLSLLVQETLKKDPHAGHLFVFRGRRGDLLKIIWHDGQGACLSFTQGALDACSTRLDRRWAYRAGRAGGLVRLADRAGGLKPSDGDTQRPCHRVMTKLGPMSAKSVLLPSSAKAQAMQRVSPDMDTSDVIALEATWKRRLHTRDVGLNMN